MNEAVNIPQLRFPEFTKALRRKSLGDFGYFYYGKSAPKWSVTEDAKTPCVRYGELYSTFGEYILDIKSHTNIPPENLKFSKGGEVLVPRVGEDPLDFAYCSFLPISDVAIGEMISVYNTKESGLFFTYYINSKLKKAFARVVEGGNVSNLYYKYLENINVTIPSLDEQDKIIDFLSAVDNKIELLRQKQELLGEYKKGLMQQIFSQAIRFKADDGSEFPEWKERRLGDVCSKAKSGGTPRSTTKEYYDGDIPFLAISDITRQGKYLTSASKKISQLGIDNSASWIVPIDTIIYSMYASVGLVSINKIPLATSQAVINLIVKDGYSIEFIYYHLIEVKKTIHKFIETGTQGNLNAQTVKSLILNIPSLPEQAKIANFLSSIDTKIEQVGKQLDESKQFKKALLQQMFV